MARIVCSCVMLLMLVVVSLCGIVAAVGHEQGGRRNVSTEEYLEMKEKLRTLNKPSVKSIQAKNGDVFDCVDIHKQPAFDHPLLKNHTIQMRPSTIPTYQVKSGNSSASYKILNTGLSDGGCPDGTVPIRRVKEKDILRANPISQFGKKFGLGSHHYATKRGDGTFYGIKGNLNVWTPVIRNHHQFSLSQFWLVNTNGILNTIEAGWNIYPHIYGDRTPRLFVYWTADNYRRTGCYNLLCPGFVQVNRFIPVGLGSFHDTSKYMQEQLEIELSVFRDPRTGHWWLTYGSMHDSIGYWPNSLFTNLERGNQVTWGGEVFVPEIDYFLPSHYPQMGSGAFAKEGFRKACYTRKLQVVADNPRPLEFKDFENATTLFVDKPRYYKLANAEDQDFKPGFFFGGRGRHWGD